MRLRFEIHLRDLVLINFSIEGSRARRLIPAELELDRPDGSDENSALVSLVVFKAVSVKLAGLRLPFPGYSQLNCRAYVKSPDGPAVYFFALRPASRLATAAARMMGIPARTSRLTAVRSSREAGTSDGIRIESDDVKARLEVGTTPAIGSEFFTERPLGYATRGEGDLAAIVATHEILKATEARAEEVRAPLLIQQGLAEPGEVLAPVSVFYVAEAVMSSGIGEKFNRLR